MKTGRMRKHRLAIHKQQPLHSIEKKGGSIEQNHLSLFPHTKNAELVGFYIIRSTKMYPRGMRFSQEASSGGGITTNSAFGDSGGGEGE